MSALEDTLKITGIKVKGNFEGNPTVNIYNTTNVPAQQETKIWKPFCTVTAPTPNFTGREDLIAAIRRQIQQCSKETEYSNKIVVIHGLGGMGKSELVRKFVQTYRQEIINAAWIDAQSKNSLDKSFKSVAKQLNLQTEDKEVDELVPDVYRHLADHNQPSLFIFDNAEQMRSEDNVFGIFDFLPTVQLDNIPLIIITTRFKDWEIPENPENIIQINELSEDVAVEFLTKRWRLSSAQKGDKTIMGALKDLARSLQGFPLALTLAASNISVSKLRSIPKEIKDYIQKLNSPHEGWIHERQSAGTASKYDLIMNNVWAATLEKIQSQGDDGEAAISLLNIIAYFSPDDITVDEVVEVAEFSALPTSTSGFEMLELYSLISLPSSTNDKRDFECKRSDSEESDSDDEYHQPIRIHRLVQRCTRDKLDREKNYTYLLNISLYLVQSYKPFDSQTKTIHQHLKERMWLKNSIQSSILFASQIYELSDKFEFVKHVHEVLARDEKSGDVQNLAEDCKILQSLNMFYLSTCYNKYYAIDYNKLYEDLISKDPFYGKEYLEKVFVSSLGKCVKDLFMGTMDMEDFVKRAISSVLIRTVSDNILELNLSAEVPTELSSILADATSNSFEGSVATVRLLYKLLWNIHSICRGILGTWCVKTVLKIHGSVYASIKETGGRRLDSYWEDDRPIPYSYILIVLKGDTCAERNRSNFPPFFVHFLIGYVRSFCTEAGLQILLQHLQYLDALIQTKIDILPRNTECLFGLELFQSLDVLTKTKIDELPRNAEKLLDFITFLGWRWGCTKQFVEANLFMETLYSITKNVFKLNAQDFYRNRIRCLMAWFGLFGMDVDVDRNGVSWSIQSVEEEMTLYLRTADSAGGILPICFASDWDEKDAVALDTFIEFSGSDQESIAVKTAKRMRQHLPWP